MAAQEIPLLGYRPKLLNRVEVAEGTNDMSKMLVASGVDGDQIRTEEFAGY
jgi:hypothetical protein